ncbi:MAG: glycosyltransferase family 2 protein [Acetatifactor sp.]|nr:glycosyltransferase family 2 protein [Acetatifactor sp.]
MTFELLVSSVGKDVKALADDMNIRSKAIIINQTDHFSYEEFEHNDKKIRAYSFNEKGVGLSRNNALMRAEGDIILFADEDIVYEDDCEEKVLKAFNENPDADMIMFNVEQSKGRETYHIDAPGKVNRFNCGRYSAYSTAVRLEAVRKAGVTFSLLFGGGAKYSNGEDSLFIRQCIKSGFKCKAVPVNLGRETERESTWFKGYNEKFFFDRGVLYSFLYGRAAYLWAFRFCFTKKKMICNDIRWTKALKIMKEGMKEAHGKNR